MEGLEICRRSLIEYSAIDWTYQTIMAYQHLAMVYEGKELPQKAKSFVEEGWRTFLSNEDVPIPTDFYNTLVDNVVRISFVTVLFSHSASRPERILSLKPAASPWQ